VSRSNRNAAFLREGGGFVFASGSVTNIRPRIAASLPACSAIIHRGDTMMFLITGTITVE
jgi:hypothetical protein